VHARVGDKIYNAAGYVGHRDRGFGPEIEVHLLDYSGDLYGVEMDVSFLHHIRADEAFTTLDALKEVIARDVAAARKFFAA
jgi:riboflavin kinase / FMN adenylyltransferase